MFNWWDESDPTIKSTANLIHIHYNLLTTSPLDPGSIGNGVVNLVGNIVHPEGIQNGISFDDLSTTRFGNMTANSFIPLGLFEGSIKESVDALLSSITTNPGGAVDNTYSNVPTTTNNDGTGLQLDVTVSGNVVTSLTVNTNNSQSLDYGTGDSVTILGTSIGGASPANDVIITLQKSDVRGILFDMDYNLQPNYVVVGNQGTPSFGEIADVHIVEKVSDFPAAINNVITLVDSQRYQISGSVNIGNRSIVMSLSNTLYGITPESDKLIYTGTGTMITSIDSDVILQDINLQCPNGTLFSLTNINYLIDPSSDPFQGRNKRVQILNCRLIGGTAGNGSTLGAAEGFGTINFNNNLITTWDDGFLVSNSLSFEGLNNKSVLWNKQAGTMFTLRPDNWSGQPGTTAGYIPTGLNALQFGTNILHPRVDETGFYLDKAATVNKGNVSGNIFFGGDDGSTIFAGSSYNDNPTFNIQGNQGIKDNAPEFQVNMLINQGVVGVGPVAADQESNPGTLTVLNDITGNGQWVLSSDSLLWSIRSICTAGSSGAAFEVGETIYAGATSVGTTASAFVQEWDNANQLLWVYGVQDLSGAAADTFMPENTIFTGISSGATAQTVAGQTSVNPGGNIKYFGTKVTSSRMIANAGTVTSADKDNTVISISIDGVQNDLNINQIQNRGKEDPFQNITAPVIGNVAVGSTYSVTQGFDGPGELGIFKVMWTG